MFRVVLFLIGVGALATGLSWLSDRPGNLVLNWEGYEVETSLFRAVVVFAFLVGLAMFGWSIVRQIWTTPAVVGQFINRRRQARGLDALSSGMIAISAGDRKLALRYAGEARKSLPNEPLTHLLRAQAAQLSGDRATSRRIFEAMLGSTDTEQLGLRGLFLEAQRENEPDAARQFAQRALDLNPKLTWPFDALFELQCKTSDWAGALKTLTVGTKHGQIEKPVADRRRAVLLTAQAQALEDENGQKALDLALEAHNLAPDLVPAATIAGRQLASRGATPKAARVIERTWKKSPHPDLSVVYAYARPGDSPRDRLEKIKRLARTTPHSCEGPIAVANAAVDARNWSEARGALGPLLATNLSPRVCTLMARIEGGERQNAGAVREWLARAVTAPRDPAWTADGMVSDGWAPISPVTGSLDAFRWRVPLAATAGNEMPVALEQLAEFAGLGASPEKVAGRRAEASSVPTPIDPMRDLDARPDDRDPHRAEPAADMVDVGQLRSGRNSEAAGSVQSQTGADPSVPFVRDINDAYVEIVPQTVKPAPATSVQRPIIVKAKPAAPVVKSVDAMATQSNGKKPLPLQRAPDDPGLDEGEDGLVPLTDPRAGFVAKTKRTTY